MNHAKPSFSPISQLYSIVRDLEHFRDSRINPSELHYDLVYEACVDKVKDICARLSATSSPDAAVASLIQRIDAL
jgi:hypothetical protein